MTRAEVITLFNALTRHSLAHMAASPSRVCTLQDKGAGLSCTQVFFVNENSSSYRSQQLLHNTVCF